MTNSSMPAPAVDGSDVAFQQYMYSYDDYDYLLMNYTYDYPNDSSITHLPLDEFVPMVTVYTLIGLLGIIGNLLVIFSIIKVKRMRSITNLFLLSLATADLLLVCVCVPAKAISSYSYTWTLGLFMCKFVYYIQAVSMIGSALTLTVMSIERFIAIRYPLKARSLCTKRHARIVIISTWVTSFATAVPTIFAIQYREIVGIHRTAIWCHKYWEESPMFGKAYELYMLLLILVIPFSVMIITYTWIANIVWHVATRRADMRSGSCISDASGEKPVLTPAAETQIKPPVVPITSPLSVGPTSRASTDDDKTRRQVVMMLMVVVVLFAVCWTPVLVNNVLVAFQHMDYLHMGYLKPLRMVFHLLSYANSCVNPFVYAFMSKNFRDGFKQSILTCIKGQAYLGRSHTIARSMTSTTRASMSNGWSMTNGNDGKTSGQRFDSIALRRPSEFDDTDNRRL
ncbi:allatostatin-A receptor-like isoform X2 [Ruditapes philippinarum]|uniref:allatostatin-A receptor-like isoform X2 n=1 Tax=Ruditapes philippinarum TaxID=129788 RepID=UPI00295AC323|nr:allatostatin-A receptor-like isoform X2 [Ruditapes philippinarum]